MSRPIDALAALLNEGKGQTEALTLLGIDPDEVMSEHECLPLDDPHNEVIDLCDGTYVQRHGAREVVDPETRHVSHVGGEWKVHTY